MSRLMRCASYVAALALGACSSSTPLERSCEGERVSGCDPHAYAEIRSVVVEPDGLMPGDPTAQAHIRVELDRCADAPGGHQVAMSARTSRAGLPDAGESLMVIALDELRDDGSTFGDETASDGIIDVMVPNPFFDLPPNRTVDLRFEARFGACSGGSLELQYTTGSEWSAE